MKVICDRCQAEYDIEDSKAHDKTLRIPCQQCPNLIVVHEQVQDTVQVKLNSLSPQAESQPKGVLRYPPPKPQPATRPLTPRGQSASFEGLPSAQMGGSPSSSQLPTPQPPNPMFPEQQQIVGALLDERYQVLKPLAKGGMGAIYIALDTDTKENVALKLVPKSPTEKGQEELQKRMKREIKILRLIEDPRVIRLLDWGNDPQSGLFYTMELLEDALTLKKFLHKQKPPFIERLRIVGELLLGLLALHEIKVIHRDLKSNNVLCIGDPKRTKIKIIDPGIARWFPNELREQLTVKTETGNMIGTPHYSAPEMWKGDTLDARTDIYQMGILTYEILMGCLPFRGNIDRMIYQHLREPVPSVVEPDLKTPFEVPEHLADPLDDLILKATEKNPDERFQTVDEFCQVVHDLLKDIEVTPTGEILSELPTKKRRKRKSTTHEPEPSSGPPVWLWAALVLTIGVVLALVVVLLQPSKKITRTKKKGTAITKVNSPEKALPTEASVPKTDASTSPEKAATAPPEKAGRPKAPRQVRQLKPRRAKVRKRKRPTRRRPKVRKKKKSGEFDIPMPRSVDSHR